MSADDNFPNKIFHKRSLLINLILDNILEKLDYTDVKWKSYFLDDNDEYPGYENWGTDTEGKSLPDHKEHFKIDKN